MCKGDHNNLLHQTTSPQVASGTVNAMSELTPVDSLKNSKLLMTWQVLIVGKKGKSMPVRALLDSGADISCVTTQVAKYLELMPTEAVSVKPCSPGDPYVCHSPEFSIHTISESQWKLDMNAVIIDRITGIQPRQDAEVVKEMALKQGWVLADPKFDKPGKIDILLGADVLPHVQLHQGRIPSIMAVPTVLGQALMGTYPAKGPLKITQASIHTLNQTELKLSAQNEVLNATLTRFWESEQPLLSRPAFSSEEIRVMKHFDDTHAFLSSVGRYRVCLPKKTQPLPLGESRGTALRRFQATERSLLKKGQWQSFQNVIQEDLDLEHARPVTPAELTTPTSDTFYLPMHGVYKSTSSTTKLRVVFDASVRSSNGVSLNDTLAVGPMLHPPLEQILLRFRTHRVALTGDISKMYREILLSQSDQQLHRFLWRPQVDQAIQTYCMQRVTFGVASSPFLAVRTLQQAGAEFGQGLPLAQHHLNKSFYVDDLLGGASTEEGAVDLYTQLTDILSKAGFKLRKFRSSSARVLGQIPESLIEPLPHKSLIDCHSASYPKALGIVWDSCQDTLSTDVTQPSESAPTKRGILSDVSKTFDVLGWITPAIFPMKLLLQLLWKIKKDWDDPLEDELAEQHRLWREELSHLSDMALPRCYFRKEQALSISLQGFCDASKQGFAAVVYLRATYLNHPPSSRLVMAKSRLAPKQIRTIPELELCGAVLLTSLLENIRTALDVPLEKVVAWSDNTIVLGWLTKSPSEFSTFVGNRITTVTSSFPSTHWHHVPSAENPADCASRGISARELKEHSLWWSGPPWLLTEPIGMPRQPHQRELDECLTEGAKSATVLAITSSAPAVWLADRYSSMRKLTHVTAYVLRAASNFLSLIKGHSLIKDVHLTVKEIDSATTLLLQLSQGRSYIEEITGLKSSPPQPILRTSHLLSLNPFFG